MIRCDDISVEMSKKPILTGVSIAPEVGEVSAILGPNGAGKSTLLKCLSGVLQPSRGRVLLDERALIEYSLNELAKTRSVLSQSNPIAFPFTVCEIVMMGRNPHIAGDYSMHDVEVVNQVLASLDVQSLKDRIFQNLSGGEQQRVQIARVLAQIWDAERACLLLDEPTAALDLRHQHQVLQFVKTLAEERGWVIVIVIHDLHLAKRYADKAILMKDGEIYRQDKVEAVLTPEHISTVFEIPPELAAV